MFASDRQGYDGLKNISTYLGSIKNTTGLLLRITLKIDSKVSTGFPIPSLVWVTHQTQSLVEVWSVDSPSTGCPQTTDCSEVYGLHKECLV